MKNLNELLLPNNAMPTQNPVSFRIRIGVTGRRKNLPDTDGLKINFPTTMETERTKK